MRPVTILAGSLIGSAAVIDLGRGLPFTVGYRGESLTCRGSLRKFENYRW